MKTFKQYLKEVGDSPYEISSHKKIENSYGDVHHKYVFKNDDGDNYETHFFHDGHTAEVSFNDPDGRMSLTGRSKGRSAKIISTVYNIMKHHAKSNPEIKIFKFSSSKDFRGQTGRNKLYKKFTDKLGGENIEKQQSIQHRISADKMRE